MENFFKQLQSVLLIACAVLWMGVVFAIFAPNVVPSDQFIDVLAWAVGVSVVWCVVYLYNEDKRSYLEPQHYSTVELTDVNPEPETHEDWLAGITDEDKEEFRLRLKTAHPDNKDEHDPDCDVIAWEQEQAEFEGDSVAVRKSDQSLGISHQRRIYK